MAASDLTVMSALVAELKKLLSQHNGIDICFLLNLGIVSKLAKLLDFNISSLSMSAMWCMANLAASSDEAAADLAKLQVHKKALAMMDATSAESVKSVKVGNNW